MEEEIDTSSGFLEIARVGFSVSYGYLLNITNGSPDLKIRDHLAHIRNQLIEEGKDDKFIEAVITLSLSHLSPLTDAQTGVAAVDHITEGFARYVLNQKQESSE